MGAHSKEQGVPGRTVARRSGRALVRGACDGSKADADDRLPRTSALGAGGRACFGAFAFLHAGLPGRCLQAAFMPYTIPSNENKGGFVKDSHGRTIDYLRISLTDRCNLRCIYCMPEEGVCSLPHEDILTLEEIETIVEVAAEMGFKHIRLTGGEPLVRGDIVSLVRRLGEIPGIEDMSLTTNATLLAPMARELYEAGIHRINISLDTLNAEKYEKITRGGRLADALDGIRAALEAGMSPVKLNTVLIGGFNDDEIEALAALTMRCPVQLRFIELMPIGDTKGEFSADAYLPVGTVLDRLPQLEPAPGERHAVARLYKLPDAEGKIGLISPLSNHFCAECNRLRLTADGCLKPCLHSAEEIPVRGLHGKELRDAILTAVSHKPEKHIALSATERSEAKRSMYRIGG